MPLNGAGPHAGAVIQSASPTATSGPPHAAIEARLRGMPLR
jgi:hypothetical protein